MAGADTRYELPRERISLLGYLCRRAHKTAILIDAAEHLRLGDTAATLLAVGRYAAAASVSYGRAYYQPASSEVGEVYREADPATGIEVATELLSRRPLRSRMTVDGRGWSMMLDEEIAGTTFGFGTLGMPAPSTFTFAAGDYTANAVGIVTTELIPLPGATRMRAHGELTLSDSSGNHGSLALTRKGELTVTVGDQAQSESLRP
jgi:hypothetical protein